MVSVKAISAQLLAALVLAVFATGASAAAWSTVAAPGPSGRDQSVLTDVSCSSSVSCIAVGVAEDGGEEFAEPTNVMAFSEGWNGSSWTVIPTADQPGAGAALLSVSCASANFCVAVGSTRSYGRTALENLGPGDGRALVEIWNGSAWSVQNTPAGGLPHGLLSDVTCLSASFCVAVGAHAPNFRTTSGDALVETWNGGRWKLGHTPSASMRGSALQGVSCAAPDSCVAVGSYTINVGPPYELRRLLAERWNGHRWIVQHPPPRSDRLYYPTLTAVSCPSRGSCLAVGNTRNGNGTSAPSPLVERWQRGRWRQVKSRLPRYSSLEDVSCPGVDRCLAIGQFDPKIQPKANATSPLMMSWSGGRLSREAVPGAPAPPSKYNYWDQLNPALFGISCPAEGGCTAVGAQAAGAASTPLVQTTSEVFAAPPVVTPVTPGLPVPKIEAGPKPTTTGRGALFRFSSSQAGAGFECKLNGEGVASSLAHWTACTSPRSYSHLGVGEKRFYVRATSGAGRSGAASWEWTILAPGAPQPLILPTTKHRAAFHATCPLAAPCRERVTIKAGGTLLGHGRYSVPAHSSKHVLIPLTGAGEQALAHRGQISATLTIVNVRTHESVELPVLLTRNR